MGGSGRDERGGAFYDDAAVFDRYREPRDGLSNPNEVMEEPALRAELGEVAGLRVLDLGCGDAAIGRVLLAAGCRRYLGVDGSANMVRAAQETLAGTIGEVVRGDIEDFEAPPDSFDVVISRLALHYVEDLGRVLDRCRSALVARGRIVFTVVHPVITAHDARASSAELRANWVVDEYFVRGEREREWLGGTVVWHHRTVEDYVSELVRAGFVMTALSECAPESRRFDDPAEYERRARVPLFLLLAGTVG